MGRKEHVRAFLIAMAFAGMFVGLAIQPSRAVSQTHKYYVPVRDVLLNWFDWGYCQLTTTAYSGSGTSIGLVTTSQQTGAYWPLLVTAQGCTVETVDYNTKLAKGTFLCQVYFLVPWGPFIIESKTVTLFTEVSYWSSSSSFTWSDWWA